MKPFGSPGSPPPPAEESELGFGVLAMLPLLVGGVAMAAAVEMEEADVPPTGLRVVLEVGAVVGWPRSGRAEIVE